MRYLWITLGVATLHRIMSAGIALLGFGIGMTAFDGCPYAKVGMPIMGVAALLDFPLVIAGQIASRISNGYFPAFEHWGMLGVASLKSPLIWRLAWSLCVGGGAAYFVYHRRLRKYGPQPTIYWK